MSLRNVLTVGWHDKVVAKTCRKGQAEYLGQVVDLQLEHQIRAVDLDRSGRDPQFVGRDLVGLTTDKTMEDIGLARRQRCQSDGCFGCIELSTLGVVDTAEGVFDRR